MDEEKQFPTVGGESLGYLFEFKPEGVFLTVYPAEDTGILFELSDMRQVLKDYSVDDYDIELLARTVREASGTPVKLGTKFVLSPEEQARLDALNKGEAAEEEVEEETAEFTIDVTKDKMTAKVCFDRTKTMKMPPASKILAAAELLKITHGVLSEEEIKENLKVGNDFVIARGTPSQNGADAVIVKKFNMGEKGRPVKNKYDQVDYKNLNLFILVKKGDVVAERIPQTQGIAGKNIYGDDLPTRNGRPKPLPNGKNTVVVGDNTVVADIDGQIIDKGNRIDIDPQFSVSGDVGVSTGNIDFTGGVKISGNVQEGFTVKATGDIEIKGMVSGAHIYGHNIYIGGGVSGMNRGLIKATGDVTMMFAENAEVEAEGSITVSDVVLHSELRAGKKVCVEGKRGLVIGGALSAGEEIRANIVGNEMNVATRLTVGINPMLMRKYREVCKNYNESKQRLSQITKTLNTFAKIDISKLPQNRIDQINALTRSQFPLAGQIERDERLIKQLENEMQALERGKIRIADTLYPGSKINIHSILKNIQAVERRCTLYVDEDFIRTGPY